jgi:hypothetical protein
MDRLGDYFKCYGDPKFQRWAWVGVAVLLAATLGTLATERGTAVRFVCAGVQAAAMTGLIVAAVLRMRHLDEMQRRIQLESIALAFAIGASVVTGWGYFEHAGAPRADWGLWLWPFFVLAWLAALIATRRRYR